jgi:hypothetical protein
MCKPTLTTLRDSMPSSQTGQAAFGSGLATRASVRPPIGKPDSVGFFSSPEPLRLFDEHDECNAVLPSQAKQVLPCLRIGLISDSFFPEAVAPQYDRGSVPKASRHALGLLSRLGREGGRRYWSYKALGKEVARHNILVNAVTPALIKTSMVDGLPPEQLRCSAERIPMGRLLRPEEVAAMVYWLASDDIFYTGAVSDITEGCAIY